LRATSSALSFSNNRAGRATGRFRSRDCGRGPASDTWSVRFGLYDLGNDLLAAAYYGLRESNRIRASARRRTLLCR